MVQFTALRRILTALVAVATAGAALWWMWGPGPNLAAAMEVTVASGAGRRSIARDLAAAGVVHSAWGFAAWALLHNQETLKAGTYRFEGSETVPAIFHKMARGQFYTLPLVIPEGFNRFDIAAAIAARGLGSANEFLAATSNPAAIRDLDPQAVSLEGYLFPATYAIPPHATMAQIVAMMVERFRGEIHKDQPAGEPPAANLHAWVTLASLVEKETPVGSERPIVASVFVNRLQRGLPLQCDPTVAYAAILAGRYTGALHRADLEYPSPYNTYLHTGLPPGPIANPGRAALLAAAHPAVTDYLYFVSTGHGSHRFARTLAEQDRNLRLYLQALRAKH